MLWLLVVPLIWVTLGALQLWVWQKIRTDGGLDARSDEELQPLRRQAEVGGTASFGFLLATLLLIAGVVLLVLRDVLGVVLLVEAVLLVAVSRLVRRQQPLMLAALGARGLVERSDRYLRRDRLARRFLAVAAVGYTANFVLGAFVAQGRPGIDVARTALQAMAALAVIGWLVVVTIRWASGDDLKSTEPADG